MISLNNHLIALYYSISVCPISGKFFHSLSQLNPRLKFRPSLPILLTMTLNLVRTTRVQAKEIKTLQMTNLLTAPPPSLEHQLRRNLMTMTQLHVNGRNHNSGHTWTHSWRRSVS